MESPPRPHEAPAQSSRPATFRKSEGRTRMPSPTVITVSQLSRLIGLPPGPVLIDVRTDEDLAADPRLIPGSVRRSAKDPAAWAAGYAGKQAVAICRKGGQLSQGVAAWLRHEGLAAET